jgi:hypothetical protein
MGLWFGSKVRLASCGRGHSVEWVAKLANKARWKHVRFKGRISLKREKSETVTAKVNSGDWQLLSAFVGWVDRHFAEDVQAVNILYRISGNGRMP